MQNQKENQGNEGEQIQTSQVNIKEKFGYGLGDMASNVVVVAVSSFLTFYYTDVIGVSAGIIGTIILLSRFLDGITDLGMGVLIDKTKSKHGKARPWILWMAVPFAIATILVFSVPTGWGNTATLIYIAITYNVLFFIYTAINVPYGTLNALITQNQGERSVLNLFRMTMSTITTLLVTYFALPMVELFGGGAGSWQLTFAIFSAVAMVLFFITFASTQERVQPTKETKILSNTSLSEGIKALFKNKYWILTVLIAILVFVFQALSTGILVYYADNILNDAGLVGLLTICFNLPTLIAIISLAPIVKRIGKRNSMLIGLGMIVAGSLLIQINPESLGLIIAGTIIRGLGFGPLLGTVFAMFADTIEYGEWKTGIRTEGLVYSGGSFGTKVGGGIGTASIGWVLAIGGYISGGTSSQPESALFAIEFLFIYFPIIVSILLAVILMFYKLDKEYNGIVQELNQN